MKKHWPTIGLLLIIAALLFWNVEERSVSEAYKIEVARDKAKLKKNDKQIRELFDSLAKQDLAALQAIQAEKLRADRAEEKLKGAIKRHENTRIIRTTSDRQRDSLVRAVLHN
jgi:hypothetical protein